MDGWFDGDRLSEPYDEANYPKGHQSVFSLILSTSPPASITIGILKTCTRSEFGIGLVVSHWLLLLQTGGVLKREQHLALVSEVLQVHVQHSFLSVGRRHI